jgi:hypothetical protein
VSDDFDPYGNLHETAFGEDTRAETRKLSQDDLSPEDLDCIKKHLDEGITFTVSRLELSVEAIHVRRPRIRNPLAEYIVDDVTENEIDLVIDLGNGQNFYKIRKVKPS